MWSMYILLASHPGIGMAPKNTYTMHCAIAPMLVLKSLWPEVWLQ